MGWGLAQPEVLIEQRKVSCVRICQNEVLEDKGLSKLCMSDTIQEKHSRTSINSGALLGVPAGEHWLGSTAWGAPAGNTGWGASWGAPIGNTDWRALPGEHYLSPLGSGFPHCKHTPLTLHRASLPLRASELVYTCSEVGPALLRMRTPWGPMDHRSSLHLSYYRLQMEDAFAGPSCPTPPCSTTNPKYRAKNG